LVWDFLVKPQKDQKEERRENEREQEGANERKREKLSQSRTKPENSLLKTLFSFVLAYFHCGGDSF
jgi:hypothetical protein